MLVIYIELTVYFRHCIGADTFYHMGEFRGANPRYLLVRRQRSLPSGNSNYIASELNPGFTGVCVHILFSF